MLEFYLRVLFPVSILKHPVPNSQVHKSRGGQLKKRGVKSEWSCIRDFSDNIGVGGKGVSVGVFGF